jgi:hypothetical protein
LAGGALLTILGETEMRTDTEVETQLEELIAIATPRN